MAVSEETLRTLYVQDKLSQRLIAEKIGCSQKWISKLMKKHGIKARTQSEAMTGLHIHGGSRDCLWISKLNKKRWKDPDYRAKILKTSFQKGVPSWNSGLSSEQQPRWGTGNKDTCKVCGEEFYALPSANRVYCSNICQGEDYKIRFKGRKVTWGDKVSKTQKTTSAFFWLNKDPEFMKKRMKAVMKKPTKPELRVLKIIEDYDFPFKYVGDGEKIIGGYNPDFVATDGSKKVIEVFGRAFHDPEVSFLKKISFNRTFDGRKMVMRQYGYDCLILWDNELGDEDIVIKKIREFV